MPRHIELWPSRRCNRQRRFSNAKVEVYRNSTDLHCDSINNRSIPSYVLELKPCNGERDNQRSPSLQLYAPLSFRGVHRPQQQSATRPSYRKAKRTHPAHRVHSTPGWFKGHLERSKSPRKRTKPLPSPTLARYGNSYSLGRNSVDHLAQVTSHAVSPHTGSVFVFPRITRRTVWI